MFAKQERDGAQVQNRFSCTQFQPVDDDVIKKELNTRVLSQVHVNAW
jgi:hypothetical protein